MGAGDRGAGDLATEGPVAAGDRGAGEEGWSDRFDGKPMKN